MVFLYNFFPFLNGVTTVLKFCAMQLWSAFSAARFNPAILFFIMTVGI
ncbi:hypothetical protein T01_7264 [Trichinella spiralis]|uniref:Uncharacterized protein n=1 Tax=Trichinella spiralis TaxID=6334 RepID=A0A0V0YVC2_TRISP|nr:hypothetical protein T01_7264 [Trichinella spiralis]